jgi:hypothetical protein
MNGDLALKLLSKILDWTDEQATEEFAWLRMMAKVKYDTYRDFLAGVRYFESLASWLQQFETTDERRCAYAFIKDHLVYISQGEMQRLFEMFYPTVVERDLMHVVGERLSIPSYEARGTDQGEKEFNLARHHTLFIGLSDGARIDALRHANVGILTNDQFLLQTQVDSDKWEDVLEALRKATHDHATFDLIYLIDDFMGTGTSFMRWDTKKNKWSGKLMRFLQSLKNAEKDLAQSICSPKWKLRVHHYIGTEKSQRETLVRYKDAEPKLSEFGVSEITFTYGTILDGSICVDPARPEYADFGKLIQKYYSPTIVTNSTRVGGVEHMGLGYGACALPLILDHNTPNNSVALLWAEADRSTDEQANVYPPMRPLFRRRQRHSQ